MSRISGYFLQLSIISSISLILWGSVFHASVMAEPQNDMTSPPDTVNEQDTIDLIFEFDDKGLFYEDQYQSPLFLRDPANVKQEIVYDPETNKYIFKEKVGSLNYRRPATMSFQDFQDYQMKRTLESYWLERSQAASGGREQGEFPQIEVGGEAFEKIFGGNTIDIRPQGTATIDFGVVSNKREDPSLDVRRRRTTNFDFNEEIAMNVSAKIGDKIQFNTNYNTEASFSFENKLKLKYEGKEDEILKLIEAGDVSLPLNSTLINGSQSLFGIKTKMKFGRATVTTVFSEQKSESKNITVQGGAQTREFQLKADDYEKDRHYFLGHYFRNNFNQALSELPIIKSNVEITKIEVWRTTIGPAREDNRNIIALSDLGAASRFNNSNVQPVAGARYPSNNANNLLMEVDSNKLRNINTVTDYLESHSFGFTSGKDYEKIENATRLDPSQYTVNDKLGFISINTSLNSDQVLAVAYQYKVIGQDEVYQVGEFSDEGISAPNSLIVKLLKSTNVNTNTPMWDLMMKNVYSIGAYQVNQEDFMLNILYSGNESGVPTGYLNEGPKDVNGVPLIRVLNLDNLGPQNNPPHDGVFDFIDNAATQGGTIESSNGRIYFTVLEPFGNYLRQQFDQKELADKYAYDSLYSMTKVGAQQYPGKNKFLIEGRYKAESGSEINLNALNVPKGSVKVTAGGVELTENVDYTVDYTLGRVKIINEGILNSGTPINISMESTSQFNVQKQRMMGAHVDYKVNPDLNLGATLLNLHERPLTQKTNFGNEPISNTMWGLNFDYETKSRFLTKMVDKLPFINTKAESRIQVSGEFAHFIPGHSRAVGKSGTTYIDDFEGSKSSIDLKNIGRWTMASAPQGQTSSGMFPETATGTGLAYGFNRARTAWYIIDPLFYEKTGSLRPPNIDNEELSSHYVRYVREKEVFPNVDPPNNEYMNLPVMNVAFYPSERGPYNYDTDGMPGLSEGVNEDGSLKEPDSRWGGMMRKIETSDFESANVEYIEFWMMDPFADPDGEDGPKDPINTEGGKLYFNLGDISEDILRDQRKSFEHGLPTSEVVENVDTTIWGRVPTLQAMVNEFDNDNAARPYQDVGYDGLRNEDEEKFFDSTYLQQIANEYGVNSEAYQQALADPSADDYHYFRGSDYDQNPKYSSVLARYKKYNGVDGNSPTDAMSDEPYPTVATRNPDVEDINQDNTLSEAERYFQYQVELKPGQMDVGENYITDKYTPTVELPNGQKDSITWYQFKIPVRDPDKVVGNIQDFKSIRFMRMFMKNFSEPVVLRFATMDLVRGEWRKFDQALLEDGEYLVKEDESSFDITAVNIEENGQRKPIPYVLPPGIERERNVGTTNVNQLNEQSMVLNVCDLEDGFARAGYKTTDFDFRQYKNLKMFVHAEKSNIQDNYETGDLTVFVRLGSDFKDNYYEYEVPLEFTDWGSGSRQDIWPEANRIELPFQKLVDAKLARRDARNQPENQVTNSTPFVTYHGKNKITVKGVPSISDVKTIMIGVRNPKKKGIDDDDDGETKCAEVWVNELRLTDFDEKSAWAATGRVKANLADLGNVVVAGSHSSPGFGSIGEKVNERQKESVTQFDLATNLQLGKFFPEESGVRIPMHFDYSESRRTPEYNPMDPDIKLKDDLSRLNDAGQDSLLRRSQDLTVRKNINFMNVRKERVGGGQPNLWDFENFNFSYAYSEIYHRNIDTKRDITKKYQGGLGYNFTTNPEPVTPFDEVSFLQSSVFKPIRDFNFNYLPKTFSFRTDMNREYNEKLLRSKSIGDVKLEPTYVKRWDWRRLFDFQYNLTRSIKVDYSATVNAYIDEPPGKIDRGAEEYDQIQDTIRNEIFNLGTIDRYNHSLNVTYNLPINKFPLLDWTSAQAKYTANYTWTASPESIQDRLGNSAENSNNIQINGNFRLSRLYNKVGVLKNLNQSGNQRSARGRGRMRSRNQSRGDQSEEDKSQEEKNKKDSESTGEKIMKSLLNNTLRILTSVKDVSINYNEANGIRLPGFMPEPELGGNRLNDMAPGWGFVFGSQKDIRYKAASNGWITYDTLMNNPYMRKHNENLSYRVRLEPFQGFRIELTGNQTQSENHTEYFKAGTDSVFSSYNPTEGGSFSTSMLTFQTAFEKFNSDNYSSAFETMKEYRNDVAARLGARNPWSQGVNDSTGYVDGYGPNSQQVLVSSFLAAYTGKKPGEVSLNPFPSLPMPNWRITFDGLTNIDLIREYFKSLNMSHAYRSTYSVGNYKSNIKYDERAGSAYARNQANNFFPQQEIGVVTISEQFSPLFSLEATLHNSMTARVEMKKTRNLSLSFTNNQLTEVKSNEWVIGLGYRVKNIEFFIKSMMGNNTQRTQASSDLNIKVDFSIKNSKTILRRIDEEVAQISAGRKMYTLNTSADYSVSQRFNLRFYFNKNINEPYISTQFPTSNTEGGISMTFSLQ